MQYKNVVVTCPPCGEQPLAPEGFNPRVAIATKRGFVNKESALTTPHRPYGALPPQVGKLTARGFTLIELLVVVLIIGILAAVAVPQYQKAVLKSKFATMKDLVKSLANAEEIYFLENGNYTSDIGKLSVDVPVPESSTLSDEYGVHNYSWGRCILEDRVPHVQAVYCILFDSKGKSLLGYYVSLTHAATFQPNFTACYAYGKEPDTLDHKICQAETGKNAPIEKIQYWY